jgi:hypothetical protein
MMNNLTKQHGTIASSPLSPTIVIEDSKFFDIGRLTSFRKYDDKIVFCQNGSNNYLPGIDWREDDMKSLSELDSSNREELFWRSTLNWALVHQDCCNINHHSTNCFPKIESRNAENCIASASFKSFGSGDKQVLKKEVSFDPKINRWNNGSSCIDTAPLMPRQIDDSPQSTA